MAVFLSPGVFPREIDLSIQPVSTGSLLPAFIGTANKGPVNEPIFVANSQQAIDVFGEPFPESFLMYALMAFFEAGTSAWVLRVGVACEDGQPDELADICIDESGAREDGWGRISVFKGIAFGQVCTKEISTESPLEFHDAGVTSINYTDIAVGTVATDATLNFTGTGLSEAYEGPIDDCFLLLITSDPTGTGSALEGAGFQVVRNSDGEVVAEGTIVESGTPGTSEPINVGDGLIFEIVVSAGDLAENDSFNFCVEPDNLSFAFAVDLVVENSGTGPTTYSFSDGDSFDTAEDFADEFNVIIGAGEDFLAIAQEDGTTCIRTRVAGDNIQLQDTEAFALEIGQELYVWDNPRSFLLGVTEGPYDITTSNNRITMNVISDIETTEIVFSLTTGLDKTAAVLASEIDTGGISLGERFFQSYVVTLPGGSEHVVIETADDHIFSQLDLQADFTHLKSLRFAETIGILFPFTRVFEAFFDSRVVLPETGVITPSSPLSCEVDALSDECAADSAYFENIVGWLVAKSAGTWLDGYTTTLAVNIPSEGTGDVAGRFNIFIFNDQNIQVDRIDDVTFDPRDERYIANVVNEGSPIGGTNGNSFVQWIDRPTFLNNDPINDIANFEARVPAPINGREYVGQANGIPTDPLFSSEIDRAIIGNPALETGIFAFQNPEVFDISLLVIPGSSSGPVIAQGLQLCESRGDCLYIIDPPFGLRPQQVVDWHNGMLFSDLTAAINSSFGALYFPWLKIFDQFNGTEIFIPPSGHAASVFARTEDLAEIWFAPAGLNRGRLITALDTEVDLTQGERDLLYGFNNAVNPIVNFPQDGITIFGQRTLQRRDSALDRVNVRMLLIFIKKNAVTLLRNFIFEPNDITTRVQVQSVLDSFMSDILGRRGVTAYKVIVDETNNTPERIDRNELHVAIFLKPTRAIEFVVLNLVILRSEQSFASDEVLAAGGVTGA